MMCTLDNIHQLFTHNTLAALGHTWTAERAASALSAEVVYFSEDKRPDGSQGRVAELEVPWVPCGSPNSSDAQVTIRGRLVSYGAAPEWKTAFSVYFEGTERRFYQKDLLSVFGAGWAYAGGEPFTSPHAAYQSFIYIYRNEHATAKFQLDPQRRVTEADVIEGR